MTSASDHSHRIEVPAPFLVKPISNPWRNRILVELHLRPMSPKQFSEDFPGPKPSTIARYFRELKDWGFIELAEKRRTSIRRGAAEKVYRAIRQVHFDTPHWELLPLYLREECTGVVLEGLVLRLREAFEAGTITVDGSQCLSCESVLLDKSAWTALTTEMDRVLPWLNELEAESLARHEQRGGALIAATAAQLAFRSPLYVADRREAPSMPLREKQSGPHFLMDPQTAKALANPWRNRILEELHRCPMSPQGFSEMTGEPDLATIGRCFRQLRDWGYVELLEEKPGSKRRGAVEKVYRAVPRNALDLSDWQALPSMYKNNKSATLVETAIDKIDDAITAGTMDFDTDRHLSWMSLWLDPQAWSESATRLQDIAAWLTALREESAKRSSSQDLIPATVSLLAFRSPDPSISAALPAPP